MFPRPSSEPSHAAQPKPATETEEAFVRAAWAETLAELTGDPLDLARRVERLMVEFEPPVWRLSPAHFVQTVVATAHRVLAARQDDRARLAQVVRRRALSRR